jgi:hypothetical protein
MRNCASEVWSFGPSRNDDLKWRGVRRVTPNPSFSDARFSRTLRRRYQPACKPGFVGHRPLARTIRDGHSSGTMFAHGLEQPTRTASLTSPCGVIAFANIPRCRPYSVLLPVWFAMPLPLPDPRCALTAPFHPYLLRREGGSFSVALSLGSPPPDVIRHRMSMEPGLSSPASLSAGAGAAVQPTDAIRMTVARSGVKPRRAGPAIGCLGTRGVVRH